MAKKNYNGVEFDDSVDYAALMGKAAAAGNNEKAAVPERKRNAAGEKRRLPNGGRRRGFVSNSVCGAPSRIRSVHSLLH